MPNVIDITLTLIDKVSPSTNQIARNMAGLANHVQVLDQVMRGLQFTLGALASAKIVDATIGTVEEFAKAEEALRRVETVAKSSGVTIGSDLAGAFSSAKEFAKDHRFTVEEVLDTYFELGSAGFDLAQSIAIGREALFLSNAVMLDAATSTQLLASVMNSLGQTTSLAFLSIEEGAVRASNALAQSIQIFAVTGEQLEAGLKFVIGSASLLGVEIEDLTTALGQLNTVGLKGSTAGTSLNQAFIQLDKAVGKLGLNTEKFIDQSGKFKTIADLINEVKRATSNLSPFERYNAIIDAFESRGARAVAALLPFSPVMEAVTKRMAQNSAEAERLSNIYENNLLTSIQKTKNQISVLSQEIGENLAPTAKGFLTTANVLAESMAAITQSLGPVGTTAGVATVAIGGMIAGLRGLSIAFALATGGSQAFAASVASAVTSVALRFGIVSAAIAASIFVFGKIAKASQDAKQKLLEIDDVRLKNVETQTRRVFESFNELNNVKKSQGIADALKIANTGLGDFAKGSVDIGKKAGLTIKEIVDIQKQAVNAAAAFEPLSSTGLKFTTPESIDDMNKMLNLITQVEPLIEKIRGGLTSSQNLAGLDFNELSRVDAILQKIAQEAGSSENALQSFAIQTGLGIEDARKALDILKISLDENARVLRSIQPEKNGASTIIQKEELDIVDQLFKTIKSRISGPIESVKKLGSAFTEVLSVEKQLENQTTKVGTNLKRFADIEKTLESQKGVSPDILKKLFANQISSLQGAAESQDPLSSIIDNLIVTLEKNIPEIEKIAGSLGNGFGKEFIASYKDRLTDVKNLAIQNVVDINEINEKLDLFKTAQASGQLPFARGPLKDLFSKSLSDGFTEGLLGVQNAFANNLRSLIDGSVASGVISGASKANAILPVLQKSLEQASASVFSRAEAGENIGNVINDAVKKINFDFDLSSINNGLVAITEFRNIVFGQLIPALGPQLGNALKTGLSPLTDAEEQIAKIRSTLLTTRSPLDKNVLEQLINFNRGSGIVGGIEIGGADLNTKIKALENLISAANIPDNGNLLSQTTVGFILDRYEKLALQAEKVKGSTDISENVSKSASAASTISTKFDDAGVSVDSLKSKISEIPGYLDKAIEKLDDFAGRLKSISGSTNVNLNEEKALTIKIGDFNISIDASGSDDIEERLDEIREELKKANERTQNDILSKLGDLLRRR